MKKKHEKLSSKMLTLSIQDFFCLFSLIKYMYQILRNTELNHKNYFIINH